jgi:hypothetical protein
MIYRSNAATTGATTTTPALASQSLSTVGNYPYMSSTTATTIDSSSSKSNIQDFTMGTTKMISSPEQRRRSTFTSILGSTSTQNNNNINNNNNMMTAVTNRNGNNNTTNNYYSHNGSSLFFLVPTLLSILWVHDDTPFVMEVFIFIALVLYGLDLMNARDGIAVGVWVSALLLTLASAFGTLVGQVVDDTDTTAMGGGSKLILLFLGRLAVEGMVFCSWVRHYVCVCVHCTTKIDLLLIVFGFGL